MAIDRIASLAVDIVVNARRARAVMSQFGQQTRRTAQGIQNLNKSIMVIGLAASAFLLLRKAIGLMRSAVEASVKAFVELEQQILDVQKIAKAPTFAQMTDDFLALGKALPGAKFDEISKAMAASARAGVRAGQELNELTEAAVLLSQVSGDIAPAEAAEGLAALAINLDGNVERAFELASTVDKLSDSFVTTSGEIIKASARLSGFAGASNIAADELLALSAAMLSTRISSTVVRTSFVRLLTAIEAEPLKAAKALGMTSEEAQKFFILARTDGIAAIQAFVAALKTLDPADQEAALRDLGLASARTKQALKLLMQLPQQLQTALDIAGNEITNSTNLLDKQAIVAQTAGARLRDLEKEWQVFKATMISSTTVVDTLIGSMELLQQAVAAPGGIGEGPLPGYNVENLPNDVNTINDMIRSVKNEIGKLNKEREELFSPVGMAAAWATPYERFVSKTGGFEGSPIGRAWRGMQKGGEVERNERLLTALLDKRNKLREQEGKTLEENRRKAKEQAEEERKTAESLTRRSRQIEREFITGLPTRPTVRQDPLQSKLAALADDVEDVRQAFLDTELQTDAMREALDAWTEDAIQARKKLIEEDKQEKLNKAKEEEEKKREDVIDSLTSVAGEFGNLINTMAMFDDLVNNEIVKKDKALVEALRRQGQTEIERMIRGDRADRGPALRGLTQAWIDAQTHVQDRDVISKEQLIVAQRMVTILDESRRTEVAMLTNLRKMAESRQLLTGRR